MKYTYFFINRPPFIGTHPDGSIASEVWQPKQSVAGIPDRTFHGSVTYTEPLLPERIWKFELHPADKQEYLDYFEWREDNNR